MLLNYRAPAGPEEVIVKFAVPFSSSGPFGFEQLFADSLTVTEEFSDTVTFNVSQDDTVALSDEIVKGIGLIEADTLTLSDVIVKGPGLVFVDSLTLSDSADRLLTIGLRLRMLLGVGT